MNEPKIRLTTSKAKATELDIAREALRRLESASDTSKNDIRRCQDRIRYLEQNGARDDENRAFNMTVNNRQVRRHYARIMAKKGEE